MLVPSERWRVEVTAYQTERRSPMKRSRNRLMKVEVGVSAPIGRLAAGERGQSLVFVLTPPRVR